MLLDDRSIPENQCVKCENIIGVQARLCKAFPKGIPEDIWFEGKDHTVSYPGDNGIQFEPMIMKEP